MQARLTLGVAAFVLLTSALAAQPPRPRNQQRGAIPAHLMIERLNRMSPEEREGVLNRLPPNRRTALEQRLRNYEQLPPAAKERLRKEYSEFQQLSPDKQEEVRRMFRRFSEIPEGRRRELRRELSHLRNMPPARRSERLSSEAFRSDYNDDERHLLESLSETLPTHRRNQPLPADN